MSSSTRRSSRRSSAPLSYDDSSRVITQLTAARAQQLYQAWRDLPEADRVEQIRNDLIMNAEADEILPALQKSNLIAICQWLQLRAPTSMNKNVLMDLILNSIRSISEEQDQLVEQQGEEGEAGDVEDAGADVEGDTAPDMMGNREREQKHNSPPPIPHSPPHSSTVSHRDLDKLDQNINTIGSLVNKSINSMNSNFKPLLQHLPSVLVSSNAASHGQPATIDVTPAITNSTSSFTSPSPAVADLLNTLDSASATGNRGNISSSAQLNTQLNTPRTSINPFSTGSASSFGSGSGAMGVCSISALDPGSSGKVKHCHIKRRLKYDDSDDDDDDERAITSTPSTSLTLNRIEDSIASAILRRVPLGQTMSQYFYGIKDSIKSKRTCHEMEVLAQGLDALMKEGIIPGASIGFEVFIRRFAALQTADATGNYAIADALSFSGHSVSLLPTTTLSAINKTLRLMKPTNNTSTTTSNRPRPSYNNRPTMNRPRPFSVPFNYSSTRNDYGDDGLAASFTNVSNGSYSNFDGGRRVYSNQSAGAGGRNNNPYGRRNNGSYNNYQSNNSSNRATPASAADG
ncbi:MAG: hypothetical protein JWL77_6826, partial [Chthonomonadaceae bacterium]|nr:hypothetical protein [Chthonomonadaceae bacterium]